MTVEIPLGIIVLVLVTNAITHYMTMRHVLKDLVKCGLYPYFAGMKVGAVKHYEINANIHDAYMPIFKRNVQMCQDEGTLRATELSDE